MAREPLVITTSWDDGHPADLRVAELLERHQMQGTFYVPTTNSEGHPVMPPDEVARLAQRFEIGGHTHSHVILTRLPPDIAAEQIRANKSWLEELLGKEIRGFAYVRGNHNGSVRELVTKAGYRYARTVKSLTSSPGAHQYAVPTTVQFYAHRRATYLRNYLRGGPTFARSAVLAALMSASDLTERILASARVCSRAGGYFHLWGHSWEIEQHDLWGELDSLLGQLRKLNGRYVDNAAWCKRLTSPATQVFGGKGSRGIALEPVQKPASR